MIYIIINCNPILLIKSNSLHKDIIIQNSTAQTPKPNVYRIWLKKHLMIAASAGEYHDMQALIVFFDKDGVSRDAINSVLTAYNNS
jgi:hypothetical protein